MRWRADAGAIGLELGISGAAVAPRKEPPGAPVAFNSDVVATAKRPLKSGELLDGEGGFTVWGRQVPADVSLRDLSAAGARLRREAYPRHR
jgi:predicted homoserine dehydrogenase-like protein